MNETPLEGIRACVIPKGLPNGSPARWPGPEPGEPALEKTQTVGAERVIETLPLKYISALRCLRGR